MLCSPPRFASPAVGESYTVTNRISTDGGRTKTDPSPCASRNADPCPTTSATSRFPRSFQRHIPAGSRLSVWHRLAPEVVIHTFVGNAKIEKPARHRHPAVQHPQGLAARQRPCLRNFWESMSTRCLHLQRSNDGTGTRRSFAASPTSPPGRWCPSGRARWA